MAESTLNILSRGACAHVDLQPGDATRYELLIAQVGERVFVSSASDDVPSVKGATYELSYFADFEDQYGRLIEVGYDGYQAIVRELMDELLDHIVLQELRDYGHIENPFTAVAVAVAVCRAIK